MYHCNKRRKLKVRIIWGKEIQPVNSYVSFNDNENEHSLEVRSTETFFIPRELQRYINIVNQKIFDLINLIKDKSIEEMLACCIIRRYG